MRPLTAKRALDGTHPRLTHVPPTTSPSIIAVLRPCEVPQVKNSYYGLDTLKSCSAPIATGAQNLSELQASHTKSSLLLKTLLPQISSENTGFKLKLYFLPWIDEQHCNSKGALRFTEFEYIVVTKENLKEVFIS